MSGGWTYRQAGVDIDAGNEAVRRYKPHVASTQRPGVLGDIGGFGGLFDLAQLQQGGGGEGSQARGMLVAGADGVGSKLKIAFALDRHDTIGIDCVAMNVNDILVQGAEPLFFLDYVGVGEARPEQLEQIVAGVAEGCRQANCALLGGETAELPDLYQPGEYDLAGFAVGLLADGQVIDGSGVADGDVIIGLPSSGLHSNGFSLARRVLLDSAGLDLGARLPELGKTLGEELLTPTKIYVRPVLQVLRERPGAVRAMAHITGGGLVENLPRSLPAHTTAVLDVHSWTEPPIFELIRRHGQVSDAEMRRVFNLGIGFVLVVAEAEADACMDILSAAGEEPHRIGRIRFDDRTNTAAASVGDKVTVDNGAGNEPDEEARVLFR